ncbi:hypothetical protein MNEG_4109 [Monoraphidium neglectum]|uniref:Uncharacterized protein n=1 Tax=Monoraphidium neglectum TaxID=145388 RepID=A0A0D2JZ98_9CHLO|nr:hypothetical protein MNEG_4109 [Monoraphidium neglectum]KIZ03843.1 hypothetical protein MNEG_4109 [Monoraphidium neglectum]|eukprot:XP_013902862.1 hypothetical protein MNEG_4109 [Monoraphidium neglectum]
MEQAYNNPVFGGAGQQQPPPDPAGTSDTARPDPAGAHHEAMETEDTQNTGGVVPEGQGGTGAADGSAPGGRLADILAGAFAPDTAGGLAGAAGITVSADPESIARLNALARVFREPGTADAINALMAAQQQLTTQRLSAPFTLGSSLPHMPPLAEYPSVKGQTFESWYEAEMRPWLQLVGGRAPRETWVSYTLRAMKFDLRQRVMAYIQALGLDPMTLEWEQFKAIMFQQSFLPHPSEIAKRQQLMKPISAGAVAKASAFDTVATMSDLTRQFQQCNPPPNTSCGWCQSTMVAMGMNKLPPTLAEIVAVHPHKGEWKTFAEWSNYVIDIAPTWLHQLQQKEAAARAQAQLLQQQRRQQQRPYESGGRGGGGGGGGGAPPHPKRGWDDAEAASFVATSPSSSAAMAAAAEVAGAVAAAIVAAAAAAGGWAVAMLDVATSSWLSVDCSVKPLRLLQP